MRVFINYSRRSGHDYDFAAFLHRRLVLHGHLVFRDEEGLTPGDQWPQRLQAEVKNCDVMVSLVSNASLTSGWVLNEIDYAQSREKRIIPVLLEPLSEDIKFQKFRPRFSEIHCLRATTSLERDAEAICQLVGGAGKRAKLGIPPERRILIRKMTEYDIDNPLRVLLAVIELLQSAHMSAALNDVPPEPDEFTGLTGKCSRSLAETIRNLAATYESMSRHNLKVHEKSGDERGSRRWELGARAHGCLNEALTELVAGWDELARRARQELALGKRESTEGD